jgi:hypothetical protein
MQRPPIQGSDSCLFAELAILGTLSFTIFLGEQIFHVQEESYYIELEFAHLAIFCLAVCLIFQAAMLIRARKSIVNYWDTVDPDHITDIESMELLLQAHLEMHKPGAKSTLREQLSLGDQMEFFFFKFLFYMHCERIEEDFDMVRYLDQCFVIEIVELIHVERVTWVYIIVVLVINWVFVAVMGDDALNLHAFIGFGFVLLSFTSWLVWYIARCLPRRMMSCQDFGWRRADGFKGYSRVMRQIIDFSTSPSYEVVKSPYPNPLISPQRFLKFGVLLNQWLMVTNCNYFVFLMLYFKVRFQHLEEQHQGLKLLLMLVLLAELTPMFRSPSCRGRN